MSILLKTSHTGDDLEPALHTAARRHCALCGAEGVRIHTDVPDHCYGVPGRWNVARCPDASCGLVWQDPMVLPQDLGLAYVDYHTHDADGGSARKTIPAGFLTLDRWLARLLKLEQERTRFTWAYLDDVRPGRLLDVGCGSGAFAALMQTRGWNVRGTDFDPQAAENARKRHAIDVDVGDLRDIAYDAGSFDAVTLRHVIEHVPQPEELVAECWRILKPGGHLVLVTPNSDSLGHRYFGTRWRGLEQPRHVFLYNPAAIRRLFERAGIEGDEIFSTAQGASFVCRKSSLNSRGRLGRVADALATWWLPCSETMRIRRGHHVGEELVACATKPGGDASSTGRSTGVERAPT